jgi:hypothetical protein
MIVTRKSLERRTFLRGIGVTLALPFLDAMVPAFSKAAASAPVRRLGFFYIPNGAIMDHWTPAAAGPAFEMTPILEPLSAHRDQLTILTGLGHHNADNFGDGNGDHSRATPTWLSGMHPKRTEGADVQAGTTADQVAAKELGKYTQLASLEMGMDANYLVGNCENGYSCVYMNTISWRTPTTPNPVENNPRVIFERMFGDGGTADQRMAQMRRDKSIIDSAASEIASLQKTLGPGDRSRVGEYVDAVRELERRIQRSEEQSAKIAVPLPDRPAGIPENYEEHLQMMFDLQTLAWQADITRVISFMMGRELSQRVYPAIGVTDAHHGLTHHQGNQEKIAKVIKINTYHMTMFARFLDKLKKTPDGEGSLLDHSMILYGGGISDGNLHNHSPLPALLAGGGAGQLKGGRHLRYPDHTPMSNLLLAMLDKSGVPVDQFGDSTGKLNLEPLPGV